MAGPAQRGLDVSEHQFPAIRSTLGHLRGLLPCILPPGRGHSAQPLL